MATVKVIKNDAIVTIEIGAGFLQKLQKVYISLVSQLTKEQIELYNTCAESGEPFPDELMDHVMTMTVLLKEIETQAEKAGFIIEQDAPDISNQQDN